nr:hypothetical protein [Tanacetum cinerariifolium]
DQPYVEDASPIAQSPEYVLEFDLEAHPEDDDEEDPEEDPVDYPADGGEDGDDEEGSDAPSFGIPLLLPISASTSSPPLQLPSASRREDRPEVTLPPQKRLGIALGLEYEVRESSFAAAARPAGGLRAYYSFVAIWIERSCVIQREVGYGITDSWDEIVETLQGEPVSTDTELGRYIREFETRVRQDTEEIYIRIKDSPTGTGDSFAGVGYRITGTAGTRWRSYTARVTRGGWIEDRPTGIGDCPTGTGDSFAGTGYRITGTSGTRWRSYTARVTRGGWSTADQETINTTSVTNAQLQAMIDQGVTAALAARDALRSTNGDDSHNFRMGETGNGNVGSEGKGY